MCNGKAYPNIATRRKLNAISQPMAREFPEVGRELLRKFVSAKVAYAANRKPEDDLVVGLKEARQAFKEA